MGVCGSEAVLLAAPCCEIPGAEALEERWF
jgi:hypothetical protein